MPERLAADGALDDLDGVDPELVVGVELQPGEQLLRSRLVEPDELVSVDVPAVCKNSRSHSIPSVSSVARSSPVRRSAW